MRTIFSITTALCCGLLAGTDLVRAQDEEEATEPAKRLLQEGLFAEEAERELDKAAASYEKLIARYEREREFAVAALYRLAEVRRKQERNDDASVLYQRILREFPEADPQARLSRENLTAMGIAVAPVPGRAVNDPEETKELRRLMMLAANSPERVWETNPLFGAATKGWLRVATWLLDYAKESGREIEHYWFAMAVKSGSVELCKLFLARGAKIEEASSALVEAIVQNLDEMAEWLIANGADPNAAGEMEYNARLKGSLGVESGVSPSGIGKGVRRHSNRHFLTPLAAAIAQDNKHWVDRLLALKADVNGKGEIPPLAVACRKGHVPLVRKLLAAGADPNGRSLLHGTWGQAKPETHGWTALHYAVETPELVKVLLDAGAEHSPTGAGKITPLFRACHLGVAESVRLLLEAGADPKAPANLAPMPTDAKNVNLVTAVMTASQQSETEKALAVIKLLVKHGADPLATTPQVEDVIAACRNADIRASLMENYRYSDLAEKKAITLSFPHSGVVFELAAPSEEHPNPPELAAALLMWHDRHENVPNPWPNLTWLGHDWERPLLRRPDGEGKFGAAAIDLLAEGGYPELAWGDILEVRVHPSSPGRGGPVEVSAAISPAGHQALLAAHRCRFTLMLPGEGPQELEAKGGLMVTTPFGPLPNVNGTSAVQELLSVRRGVNWAELRIKRAAKYGGQMFEWGVGSPTRAIPSLMDGDVVTVDSIGEASRDGSIRIIDAKSKAVLRDYHLNRGDAEFLKAAMVSDVPTLFQAIANCYKPVELDGLLEGPRDLNPEMQRALRFGLFEEPEKEEEKPSEEQVRRALSAAVRILHEGRILLPHPDFSVVRIRRMKLEGGEEIIEVPLGKFINECAANTPGAECRARDLDLQRGDIVELSAHYDRIGQPWKGFDEAAARFFRKALTYEVGMQPAIPMKKSLKPVVPGEEVIKRTMSWAPARYFETSAGPVGVVLDREWFWSTEMPRVAGKLFPERSVGTMKSAWIRHGSLIPEPKKPSGRPGSTRRRYVPTPPPSR